MVLVVDDNHHMRMIVNSIMRAMGIIHIREASDGVEALQILKDWKPDIVIVDLVMGTLDGLDFTKLLRTSSDSPCPFVPVIMMTGHSDRKHVLQARDAGVSEFIAKPLTAKVLMERINNVVYKKRMWVKASSYTGPDRRRKVWEEFLGPFKRSQDNTFG